MTKQYLMPASRITTGTAVPTSAGTAGDLYVRNTDPYPSGYIRIGTPAELVAFAARVNAGESTLNACLTADIDMTGVSYTPIGTSSKQYSGTFDGYGHTISNLTMTGSNYLIGLFGQVSSATIQNIVCSNFNISGNMLIGGVVGYALYESNIKKCCVLNSTLTSSSSISGGIAGSIYSSSNIEDCYALNCTISASERDGGIVGSVNSGGVISNCYAYNCSITGSNYVGGLVGMADQQSTAVILNCAVYGGTHGSTIVGYGSPRVMNCYGSSGVTSEVFHTQEFWDGTGISEKIYLYWDFADTWEWDSTNNLPKLKAVVSTDTAMYTYNGSSWSLQKTILDTTPVQASEHGITSGGAYDALTNKLNASKVTVGTAVPATTGSKGDLYVKNTPVVPSGYIAICTPAELVAFAARVNAGETSLNACLIADIDMDGVSYTPIGNSSYSYSGIFDGYGCTVSNLTVTSSNDYIGLFGHVTGATIRNIICDNFTMSGDNFVGGLIGYAYTDSTVQHCCVKNSSISGEFSPGGVTGMLYESAILNCHSYNCTVTCSSDGSGSYLGGLIGMSTKTDIANCYVYKCVFLFKSGNYVGCLGGSILGTATVSNCAVYGGTHGHVLYDSCNATITNCYTSASSGLTAEIFHTQGFWNGTGVSGTTYLSWDFDDTWDWDSTNSLPKLQGIEVSAGTSLYAYNGSSWVLQNTVLDAAPTSASANGVTSGGVYTSLSGKQDTLTFDSTPTSASSNPVTSDGVYTALSAKQKSITVSTSEPTSSEGSDGDLWLVYTA